MTIHKALWSRHRAVRSGDQLSFGEKAADKLKHGFGSWTFLILLNIFIAGWVVLNLLMHRPFDSYPYILLNLLLSWLAAQQGGALQIASNRGDRIASEVALHTERTTEELLVLSKGQLEILHELRTLQKTLDEKPPTPPTT